MEVSGTQFIGVDTARELETYRLVVWAKHGVLSTGKDYQDCFGLIGTADKASHIALELKKKYQRKQCVIKSRFKENL